MTTLDPRQALLDFLDQRVFLPAINANPANYATQRDRRLLESVKKRVTATRLKYQTEYHTAAQVKTNFFRDLDSPFGQTIAGDMFILKLQRFEDMEQSFANLFQTLGV